MHHFLLELMVSHIYILFWSLVIYHLIFFVMETNYKHIQSNNITIILLRIKKLAYGTSYPFSPT